MKIKRMISPAILSLILINSILPLANIKAIGENDNGEFYYIRASTTREIDSSGDNLEKDFLYVGVGEKNAFDATIVWKATLIEFQIPDGVFEFGLAFVTLVYQQIGTIPTLLSIVNNKYLVPIITWIDLENDDFSANETFFNVNSNNRLIIAKFPPLNGTVKLILEPALNCTNYSYFDIYENPFKGAPININEDALYTPPILCALDEDGNIIYPPTEVEETVDDEVNDIAKFMETKGLVLFAGMIAIAFLFIAMKRKR